MKAEPGDYRTDIKYAFTETIDKWLAEYSGDNVKYQLTITSVEMNSQRKFVLLGFKTKKEATKITNKAIKLFQHETIHSSRFVLSKIELNLLVERATPLPPVSLSRVIQ